MNSEQRLYTCRQWLKWKYIDEEKTIYQIGAICGVHGKTIWNWLKRFNIEIRGYNPGLKGYKTMGEQITIGARVPKYINKAVVKLAITRKKPKAEIIRSALIEYCMKNKFSPFKED